MTINPSRNFYLSVLIIFFAVFVLVQPARAHIPSPEELAQDSGVGFVQTLSAFFYILCVLFTILVGASIYRKDRSIAETSEKLIAWLRGQAAQHSLLHRKYREKPRKPFGTFRIE